MYSTYNICYTSLVSLHACMHSDHPQCIMPVRSSSQIHARQPMTTYQMQPRETYVCYTYCTSLHTHNRIFPIHSSSMRSDASLFLFRRHGCRQILSAAAIHREIFPRGYFVIIWFLSVYALWICVSLTHWTHTHTPHTHTHTHHTHTHTTHTHTHTADFVAFVLLHSCFILQVPHTCLHF